jgi:hypothetical protein
MRHYCRLSPQDGTAASLDDHHRNQLATQCSVPTENGTVTVVYPEIVAVTKFDTKKRHWVPASRVRFLLQPSSRYRQRRTFFAQQDLFLSGFTIGQAYRLLEVPK